MNHDPAIDYSATQPTDRLRLRWRARRGLLENDLFMQRFFSRYGDALDDAQVRGLAELLELPDNDLLDLLMGRTTLAAGAMPGASPDAQRVLLQLRGA